MPVEVMPQPWLMAKLTELNDELKMAQEAQATFLPLSLPDVNGLTLFAECQPAQQVGGDYYDFVRLSADHLFFTVGDVSNMGLPAALFTPLIRKVVRTALKTVTLPTPPLILDYVNADLYDEFTQAAMFTTLFIGQYEAAHKRLRYVNAAQSPVIYRPAQGSAYLLKAEGLPIGIFAQNPCYEAELSLNAGDLLLIGTDGLVEVRNPSGEMFGYKRLLHLVDTLGKHSTPANMSAKIFQKLTAFAAQHRPEDDQTLLLLQGM